MHNSVAAMAKMTNEDIKTFSRIEMESL